MICILQGIIDNDQVDFIILNKVIIKCLLLESSIGFQTNSMMLDFSLTSSIQTIKTEVYVTCLNRKSLKIKGL